MEASPTQQTLLLYRVSFATKSTDTQASPIKNQSPLLHAQRNTEMAKEWKPSERFFMPAPQLGLTSTTQFAREAYEIYFLKNTCLIASHDLPEFLNRKTLHHKNEGCFDIGAWIDGLQISVDDLDKRAPNGLAEKLRQLLACPRLHTVNIQVGCSWVVGEKRLLFDDLRTFAEVCAQLRGKMGDKFTVENDEQKDEWGIRRQALLPWDWNHGGRLMVKIYGRSI